MKVDKINLKETELEKIRLLQTSEERHSTKQRKN